MPSVLKWGGGHRSSHKESVSPDEFLQLQHQLAELKEECDDAVGNLELARASAKTLEEQYRASEASAARFKLALAASEAARNVAKEKTADGARGASEEMDAMRAAAAEATSAAEIARRNEAKAAAETAQLRSQLASANEEERQLRE
ncbi:unnamed protein product, partial [Polarella glacialis]